MDISTVCAFAGAFLAFAVSPGPDNMTIVARTVSHGAPSGLAYGAGMVVGILIFLVLAAFGLSVLAAKMTLVTEILRYGGSVYLIWMGLRLWTAKPVVPESSLATNRRGLATMFLTGITLNLGNPKMPLFYVALLPSIVGATLTLDQVGILAALIVAVETVVVGVHVLLATRARSLLRTPHVVRRVNRTAGGVMVGAGVAIIATR